MSVGTLRRNHTSGVGGEADMPRRLNRRVSPNSDMGETATIAAAAGVTGSLLAGQ